MDMVNMSKRKQPHRDKKKMATQGHPWVFNERRRNPRTTGQAAAGPKTTIQQIQRKSCPQRLQHINFD